MRLVIALGGNALLKRGEPYDIDTQRTNVAAACSALVPLCKHHQLIITHGNGPQIGMLANQARNDGASIYPLDVLGAESEGMIGYLVEQELRNLLPDQSVANLLTQTLVDAHDPAFRRPTKMIGQAYEPEEARAIAAATHWTMKLEGGKLRRVVPSPAPKAILELDAITTLSDAGSIVICCGGGGVPVMRTAAGQLRGAEAVVDKDLTSALLAKEVGASALFMLTDVDGVYENWGTPDARLLHQIGVHELNPARFEAGSMQPKVRAAQQFVRETGCRAGIGATTAIAELLHGKAGTTVNPLL